MDLGMKVESPPPIDPLSQSWCSSAIQVFQPPVGESLTTTDKNLKVDGGEHKSRPQWKFDDLKSWIWVQQAIHPELDYNLCFRKKWFSRKVTPWTGISIKKWMKEKKQRRKEEERLQRAEVHAAISVAGVAAALAAIAAENTSVNQPNDLKETAVASAAALVAAQCAQVAEAVGAKRDQLTSAINAATTATDASNIITLTAAAATSLRGAATLRGRPGHKERIKGSAPKPLYNEFDFDFGKCRASLAQGDKFPIETPDGKCRLRSVSIVLNRDGKVVLKVKKINLLMAFTTPKESIVYNLQSNPLQEPIEEAIASYSVCMTTSKGKIELKIDDYAQYKKWNMTINHMLMLSATFGKYEIQFCRD